MLSAVATGGEDVAPHSSPAGSARAAAFDYLLPAVASAVLAVIASVSLFPLLSQNHDEPAYLLQAEALRSGQLTLPAPAHGSDAVAFRPWLTRVRGSRYVFKYTPVHAAFLALGRTLTGSYRGALAGVAFALTLAFAALARTLVASRPAARLATWAFALSPMVMVLNATYLSYGTGLLLLVVWALLLIRGVGSSSPRLLAASGAAAGFAFFARPFDALLFGLPLAFILLRAAVAERWMSGALAFVAGMSPPLLLVGLSNRITSGSALHFPFTELDRLDTFGFGPRRMAPQFAAVSYTVGHAFQALILQAGWLLVFLFGGPLLVLIAVRQFKRTEKASPLRVMAALVVIYPVGYFFFWGTYNLTTVWGGVRLFGPFYWLPMLVPITCLAAAGLEPMLRQGSRRRVVVAGLLLGITVACSTSRAVELHLLVHRDRTIAAAVRAGADPAARRLILVSSPGGAWVGHPFPFLTNDRLRARNDIFAVSRGGRDIELAEHTADRNLYRLDVYGQYDALHPRPVTASVVPLVQARAPTFDVAITVHRRPDESGTLRIVYDGQAIVVPVERASADSTSLSMTLRLSPAGFVNPPVPIHLARPGNRLIISAHWRSTASESSTGYRIADGELTFLEPGQAFRTSRGRPGRNRATSLLVDLAPGS